MLKSAVGSPLAVLLVIASFGEGRAATPTEPARPASRDIVAYCRLHPTDDHPNKTFFGPRNYERLMAKAHAMIKAGESPAWVSSNDGELLPKQVAAIEGADLWRCQDGKVLICEDFTDGSACAKKADDQTFYPVAKKACEANPNQPLDMATAWYAASDWGCDGTRPVAKNHQKLDERGYEKDEWQAYVVKDGVVISPQFDR
jgi:hypothetical protein